MTTSFTHRHTQKNKSIPSSSSSPAHIQDDEKHNFYNTSRQPSSSSSSSSSFDELDRLQKIQQTSLSSFSSPSSSTSITAIKGNQTSIKSLIGLNSLPGIIHFKPNVLDGLHVSYISTINLEKRLLNEFFPVLGTEELSQLIPSFPVHYPLDDSLCRYKPYTSYYLENQYHRYIHDHDQLSMIDKTTQRCLVRLEEDAEEQGNRQLNGTNQHFEDAITQNHLWFGRFPGNLHRGDIEIMLPLTFDLPHLSPTLFHLVRYFGKATNSINPVITAIQPLDIVIPASDIIKSLQISTMKECKAIDLTWLLVIGITLYASTSTNIPFHIDIQLITKTKNTEVLWLHTKGASSTCSNQWPTGYTILRQSKYQASGKECEVLYHGSQKDTEHPEFTRIINLDPDELLPKGMHTKVKRVSPTNFGEMKEYYKINMPTYTTENPIQRAKDPLQHIVMEEWYRIKSLVYLEYNKEELKLEKENGSERFVYIPVILLDRILKEKFDLFDKRKLALDTRHDIVLRLTPHWKDKGVSGILEGENELIQLLEKIRNDTEMQKKPIEFYTQLRFFTEPLEVS